MDHVQPLFRPARPADADATVPLIYSSGPAAFDYVFDVPGRGSAQDFLKDAFIDGAGEFGWRNHVVGELDGRVVAAGAAWDGTSTFAFTRAALAQILSRYGVVAGTGVAVRGLRVESVVQPPPRDLWYVAHLGVPADLRGRGIGEALVLRLLELGRARGFVRTGLDVAVTNPAAERLYARLGYVLVRERASRLANDRARVPAHRRMEGEIAAIAARITRR
ncbi:MAG: GNAT family N-acetyltransferase [Steroidobacteraceae bacterium]